MSVRLSEWLKHSFYMNYYLGTWGRKKIPKNFLLKLSTNSLLVEKKWQAMFPINSSYFNNARLIETQRWGCGKEPFNGEPFLRATGYCEQNNSLQKLQMEDGKRTEWNTDRGNSFYQANTNL